MADKNVSPSFASSINNKKNQTGRFHNLVYIQSNIRVQHNYTSFKGIDFLGNIQTAQSKKSFFCLSIIIIDNVLPPMAPNAQDILQQVLSVVYLRMRTVY